MKQSAEVRFKQVMAGSDRSVSAAILRAAAACAEPIYGAIMRLRNALYDSGLLPSHSLGRPTISVGNITTGGTGKTPIVRWLADQLSAAGHKPAILLRGYKSTSRGISDEQALLAASGFPVIAGADRRRGAAAALRATPGITHFILDDAMQHRRVRRDFEIVLINSREPFGFGRGFPRGLLREPLNALRRADAFIVTHCDEVDAAALAGITATIQKYNARAPVFQADHVIQNLRSPREDSIPIQTLMGKKYFAFCGIGSPASFFWRLNSIAGECAGSKAFDDHYEYRAEDIPEILGAARFAGADLLITTEKDWVKLSSFAGDFSMPIFRAELCLRFWKDHQLQLMRAISEPLAV